MTPQISAPARLLRGFALDFLAGHDLTAVTRIMDPDYSLTIGGHVFAGRDGAYLPATAAQLAQFPGLCVTVHDVMLGPDAVAMRFTEHGASLKHDGRAAAWGGVTMFRIQNGRLRYGWAEEDYFARKRQLASGSCDAVKAPHPAPWDVSVQEPDPSAVGAVRAWFYNPKALARSAIEEISAQGPRLDELISVDEFSIGELVAAGSRVAFRVIANGRYAGGFPEVAQSKEGTRIALSVMGLLTVASAGISNVQIVYDRLGLQRQLLTNP